MAMFNNNMFGNQRTLRPMPNGLGSSAGAGPAFYAQQAQYAQRQPSDIRMNRPFGMANLPRPTQSAGGRVLQGVVAGAQANPNIQPSYGSGINPNASPDLRSAVAVGQAMNSVERASQGARLATPQYRSPARPTVNPAEVVPYGMGPQSRVPRSRMMGARNVLNGQAQDTNTAMRPLNIPGMVYDEANGRMIPRSQVPRASTADQRNAGLGGMTPNQFRAAQTGEYDGPVNETAGGILRRQQAAANFEVLDNKQYSPADWQARAERQSLRKAFTARGGSGRAGFNNFVNNYYNQNGGSSRYNDQFNPGDRAAAQQAAYRILRPGAVDRYGSDRRPITGTVRQNPAIAAQGALAGGVANAIAPQAPADGVAVQGSGRAALEFGNDYVLQPAQATGLIPPWNMIGGGMRSGANAYPAISGRGIRGVSRGFAGAAEDPYYYPFSY